MPKYTITISDAEVRAMKHVCVSIDEWVQNAFRHRVDTAINGLSDLEMSKAIKEQKPILTNRLKLVEMSNEPLMEKWVSSEEYKPNPDNPFTLP